MLRATLKTQAGVNAAAASASKAATVTAAPPVKPTTEKPAAKPEPPVLDAVVVHTEVVQTPTPDPLVQVESVNTSATHQQAGPDLGSLFSGGPSANAAATDAITAEAPKIGVLTGTADSAVATVPKNTTVARQTYGGEGIDGDWNETDVRFPQLKIVQGSGPLSQLFDNGTIILGDELLLTAPSVREGAKNPVIPFVPVILQKQYREKLSEELVQQGEMPRIVNSVQEVEDLGGTTVWAGKTMPDSYWEPSAKCMFLLGRPEGSEHPGFSLELDGREVAAAMFYAAGGAYRDSAKVIFNTALTSLMMPVFEADGKTPKKNARGMTERKPMLFKCWWNLSFAKKTFDRFTVWRPSVRLTRTETGPEMREYIHTLLTAGSHDAVAAD